MLDDGAVMSRYLTFINSPKCLSERQEGEEAQLLAPLSQTLREELRMASYPLRVATTPIGARALD